ncbi:MAG: threonylcarbamoyl-AMP synthase [Deltaproteobacteria bacterium]|nr:MAG: threonylcarbamoyl-AMP synthase [Deltaproteobacteria bacterium]
MADAALTRAIAALSAGGVVVYPTETVYGLGVDGLSRAALETLFALKGARRGTGVSLLVTGVSMAEELIERPLPDGARRLMQSFWPGPLTIVVPASAAVPRALLGPAGGVGLRCSSDPLAAALVAEFARPLTSTSANPTGRPPATSVGEARAYFGDRVSVYLDGGRRNAASASTVVEFSAGKTYLRRSGEIGRERLESVVSLDCVES